MEIESDYPQVLSPIFSDPKGSPGEKQPQLSKLQKIYKSNLCNDKDCNFTKARDNLGQKLGTDCAWRLIRSFVVETVNEVSRDAIKPVTEYFEALFPEIPKFSKSKAATTSSTTTDQKHKKMPSKEVNPEKLHKWSQSVAFVTMCRIAMGKISASLEKGLPDFIESFREAVKGFGDGETYADMKVHVENINKFLDAVVKARQAEVLNGVGGGNRQDLLWRLISNKDREMTDKRDLPMLRNMVKIFLVAGTTTVSTALTWFFRLLAINSKNYPDFNRNVHIKFHTFQRKIYWEVEGMENWRNQYLLERLNYLKACVSEAIRIHSPAQDALTRQKPEPVVPVGGSVHCRPMRDSPPNKFIPERWLDGTEYFVGLDEGQRSRMGFCLEEMGQEDSFMKEMLFVVVQCVAIAVLCRYKVAEELKSMRISVVDKDKREKKRKQVQEEEQKLKAEKERREKERKQVLEEEQKLKAEKEKREVAGTTKDANAEEQAEGY